MQRCRPRSKPLRAESNRSVHGVSQARGQAIAPRHALAADRIGQPKGRKHQVCFAPSCIVGVAGSLSRMPAYDTLDRVWYNRVSLRRGVTAHAS